MFKSFLKSLLSLFKSKPPGKPTAREAQKAQTKLECLYVRMIRNSSNDEEMEKIITTYQKARGALNTMDVDRINKTIDELKAL